MTAAKRKPRLELVRQREPEITHDGYERIDPGEYLAYCRAARIYRDPGYQRWMCLMRWDVLDLAGMQTIARIPQWLYIGRKPHAGRRSQYWREWCRAHGGPPPRKDRMTSATFVRRMARVIVRDSGPPAEKNGQPAPIHVPYSVVGQILSYETGARVEYLCTPVPHTNALSASDSEDES